MPSFFSKSPSNPTKSAMPLASEDRLEQRTQQIGQRLMTAWRRQNRRLSSLPRGLSDKLLDWAMSDPQFKVQLFRFIDVFPTLKHPAEIHDVLLEYLHQPDVVMPSGLEWGLKAGAAMKGTLAKTISANIARMAETFIAGRDAREALPQLRQNWQRNIAFTVDLLGEACLSDCEADVYRERYLRLLAELDDEVRTWPANSGLETDGWGPIPRTNISVKISSLSAHLKPEDLSGSMDRLFASLQPILEEAARRDIMINFDMEQAEWKDLTIALFQHCCERIEFPAGLALQAYLRSGPEDAARLVTWSRGLGRPVTVRLIKGAYWDYEVIHADAMGWPTPVWTRKSDTDACFEWMTQLLVDGHPDASNQGGVKLALGSHNLRSIAWAMACVEAAGLPPQAVEFQLLEGMAQGLRRALVDDERRVRAYVPLGEMIPGMAYLVRRLLENTSNESWLRGQELSSQPVERLLAAPEPLKGHKGQSEPAQIATERGPRHRLGQSIPELAGGRFFENEPLRDFAVSAQRDAFAAAVSARCLPPPVSLLTVVDAQHAVQRARAAATRWEEVPVLERASALLRTADALRRERDAWASLIILEAGKTWREADAEVCEAIDFCEYYARQAVALFRPEGLGALLGESNLASYRPTGVAVAISPWNFPLAICAGMTVASLVTGNPTLVKPAEQTGRVAQRLCEVLWDCGVPSEVLQFVPGPGETVGAHLARDRDVALIAFTGSRAVGFEILRAAGELDPQTPVIKKVICEMGGKNAIIVDSTADLDQAVAGVCSSAFGYGGQKCSACSRAIVVESLYEAFLDRLIEMARSLTLGDPRNPATDIGPLIDQAAAERVRHYIELGMQQNQLAMAVAVPAHVQDKLDKPLVGPHIFRDVQADQVLARDEIFGPVLAVLKAKSCEHALDLANQSNYKLTGAIYSRTPSHLELARQRFQVGNLYLNRGSTGALVGRQPFGGFGHSGTGTKAGGPDYLKHFVNPLVICENTLRRGFAPDLA